MFLHEYSQVGSCTCTHCCESSYIKLFFILTSYVKMKYEMSKCEMYWRFMWSIMGSQKLRRIVCCSFESLEMRHDTSEQLLFITINDELGLELQTYVCYSDGTLNYFHLIQIERESFRGKVVKVAPRFFDVSSELTHVNVNSLIVNLAKA